MSVRSAIARSPGDDLSRRTVVTFQAVIKLIHTGYWCPDPQCPGRSRIYRSVEADALALPGFTWGSIRQSTRCIKRCKNA